MAVHRAHRSQRVGHGGMIRAEPVVGKEPVYLLNEGAAMIDSTVKIAERGAVASDGIAIRASPRSRPEDPRRAWSSRRSGAQASRPLPCSARDCARPRHL